jgi:predicted transcriptional regulator
MDKPRTLTFQPDEGIRELLEKIAEEKDRSLSWVVNAYLRKGLQAEKRLPAESTRK